MNRSYVVIVMQQVKWRILFQPFVINVIVLYRIWFWNKADMKEKNSCPWYHDVYANIIKSKYLIVSLFELNRLIGETTEPKQMRLK